MGNMSLPAFILAVCTSMFRLSAPLLFASTGEIMSEKAGVSNIGLEGQMIIGAFTSLLVSYETGSVALGLLAAGVFGALSTLVITYLGVMRKQNQSVVGLMFNILATGLTTYLYRMIYGVSGVAPTIDTIKNIHIPGLSDLPVLGPTIFSQNLLVYLAIALSVAAWYILNKTKLGLCIRAVGENPRAAQAAGLDVIRYRAACMLFTGFMAGIGGAFLVVAINGRFIDDITAGRGYIALAITILAGWNPLTAIAGSMLFGAADALQLRAQTLGFSIPYQAFVMLPYVVVLVSLLLFGRNAPAPRALGMRYEKEGR